MSIYSSKRKNRRVSKSHHSGHLKLSVIEESSALVVHIFEARGLQRREGASLDTYVKIYLLPDPNKQTKERTKNVKQKDPVFNQKFSFILGEADQSKQLFISVWTNQMASRNEMLGCMTFKVAELLGPNKGINGWYQVLDEVRGRSENMAVPTTISKHDSTMSKYESTALIGQKVFTVMVMKGPKGYGFSVSAYSPVHITEVVKGLPAANADLRVGDVLMELQGNSIRNASGGDVVGMIQKSPNTIHMILQRDLANPQHLLGARPSQTNSLFNALSHGARSKSYLSIAPSLRPDPSHDSSLLAAPQETPRKRHSMHYNSQSQLMPEYHENPYLATLDTLDTSPKKRTLVSHFATLRRGKRANNSYETGPAAVLSQPEPAAFNGGGAIGLGYGQGGVAGVGGGFGSELYPESRTQMLYGTATVQNSSSRKRSRKKSPSPDERQMDPRFMGALSQPTDGFMEFPGTRGGGSMRNPPALTRPPTGGKMFGRKGSLTQQQEEVGEEDHTYFARTSSMNPRRPAPIRAAPSRPAPKVPTVVISDTVVEEAAANDAERATEEGEAVEWMSLTPQEQKRQKSIQNILSAELTLCKELETGVETYLQPLKQALTEESYSKIFQGIPELYAFSCEFIDRLKSRMKPYTGIPGPSVPTHYLSTFADIYAAKLKVFVENLKVYARNSQTARQEIALSFTNDGFTKVAELAAEREKPDMYSVVGAGKEYIQTLVKWMAALFYTTPVHHPDQNFLHSIVDALIPLSSDKELQRKWERDAEVMKSKQLCVGFGAWVTPFLVQVPGRVLLHEGEVSIVEKRKKKKLWLMLFSDIVLLSQRHGKIFTCIERPIFLENLTVPDINCEPTEFQLVEVEGTLNRLIRAPSVAARDEWVAELKERASGSLANRKKPGEKYRNNPRLQEQLRKQSHLLAATLAVDSEEVEVTSHNPMTPILESSGEKAGNRQRKTEEGSASAKTDGSNSTGGKPEGSLSQPVEQADTCTEMKRGASKRRSLFNVGKGKAKAKDKKKTSKSSSSTSTSPILQEHHICPGDINVEVLREWETSFNSLLKHPDGVELFEGFLKSEFSEENIQFWKACERYKTVPDHMVEKEAAIVYEEFVAPQAPKLVNIDHQTSREIVENMRAPDRATFTRAQQSIYLLMARDSFVRFIKSEQFQQALKRSQ